MGSLSCLGHEREGNSRGMQRVRIGDLIFMSCGGCRGERERRSFSIIRVRDVTNAEASKKIEEGYPRASRRVWNSDAIS